MEKTHYPSLTTFSPSRLKIYIVLKIYNVKAVDIIIIIIIIDVDARLRVFTLGCDLIVLAKPLDGLQCCVCMGVLCVCIAGMYINYVYLRNER